MKKSPIYIVIFFVIVAFIFLIKILFKVFLSDKKYLWATFFYLNSHIKTERFVNFYNEDQRFRDLIKKSTKKEINCYCLDF